MEVQATATNDGMVLRIPDTESEPPERRADHLRPRAARVGRHRRGGRLGAVRRPVPGERGPGPAAAPARPEVPLAAVAAADAVGPAADRRRPVPGVPDRAGDDAGVPDRRVRPGRAARGAARRSPAARCPAGRGGDPGAVAVRPVAALRLRRGVRLRGRRAAGREEGRRALAGRHPAGRAARQGRAEAAAGRRGDRRHRGRSAGAQRGAAGRRARSSCSTCSAPPGPFTRAELAARSAARLRPRRRRSRRWSRTAGWSRSGSPARRWSRSPRTCPGCGTVSASRCRRGWRPRSPSRWPIPIADLVLRWARTHGPFVAADRRRALRPGPGRCRAGLSSRWSGPARWSPAPSSTCRVELGQERRSTATPRCSSLIKRRTLALLRQGRRAGRAGRVRPVPGRVAGHRTGRPGASTPCCRRARAARRLRRCRPARSSRSILPARVADYAPGHAGRAHRGGRGRTGSATVRSASRDGWVRWYVADRSRTPASVEPASLPGPGAARRPRPAAAPTSSTPCCRPGVGVSRPAAVRGRPVGAGLGRSGHRRHLRPRTRPGHRRRAPAAAPAGGPHPPGPAGGRRSRPARPAPGSRHRPRPGAGRWSQRGTADRGRPAWPPTCSPSSTATAWSPAAAC